MRMPRSVAALIAAGGLSALATTPGAAPPPPAAEEIAVYAAVSLRDVLERLAPACERATGTRLVLNFGASNDLARQIEAGNKADVFFSADEAWMDRLARSGLVDDRSRGSWLSNRLVVVAPPDGRLRVDSPADLASPAVRRIAIADPRAVPAGKYARAWLEQARVWDRLEDRILPALDVRAALASVESGAADLGVVYRTDALLSAKARVVYEVPEGDGPHISYAIAALSRRPRLETARRVVAWLAGPEAAATFGRLGFIVPRAAR